MAELAPTACRRCRRQKLRCSREQPRCDRCTRLGAVCVFPEPPDRKLIASTRALPKKRKAGDDLDHEDAAGEDNPSSWPRSPTRNDVNGTIRDACVLDDSLLTLEVQKLFRDVFFTYVFNSSLLLHRPTFERDLMEGRVPRHLILAVYAMASNFLGPPSPMALQHIDILRPLGDVAACGQQWATESRKAVLPDIDTPHLDVARTCQILSLYWFARDEPARNTMLSGIALRGAQMIINDESTESWHWLRKEMLHRVFWAAWVANCVKSDTYSVGTSSDVRTKQIPLPISEANYLQGIYETPKPLSDSPGGPSNVSEQHGDSLVAEIIVVMWHWTSIRDHLETRRYSSNRGSLADLLALDDKITKWASSLPSHLVYSKRHLYEHLVVKQQTAFIFLHSLYLQCRLVLHSSLVPQFGGLPLPDDLPREAVRISAHIALKTARSISEVAADLLALDWEVAQLAPFFGYCMYVSASIHVAFTSSPDAALAAVSRRHLSASTKVLELMKPYWKNLERLWDRIHLLMKAQANSHNSTGFLYGNSASPDTPSHLEQIAGVRRETGALPEPLAESVLEYSLKRLQHRSTSSTDMSSIDPSLRPEAATTNKIPDQQPISQEHINLANSSTATFGQMLDSPVNNELGFWDIDLDQFPDDLLSYLDLIGMDGIT